MNLNETGQLPISSGMHFSVAEYIEEAGASEYPPKLLRGIPLHRADTVPHSVWNALHVKRLMGGLLSTPPMEVNIQSLEQMSPLLGDIGPNSSPLPNLGETTSLRIYDRYEFEFLHFEVQWFVHHSKALPNTLQPFHLGVVSRQRLAANIL